jgi:hypothetical protein
MSMKTKTTTAAALAALAVPGAALAEKPAEPGKQGRDNAAAQQNKTSGKAKQRAIVVRGVDVAGLTVTDGKLAGAITLDPTSANRHARRVLELTKAELRGDDTITIGTAGDAVVVTYEGLSSSDELKATDVVKIKARRTRDGAIDIRKITVTRPTAETEAPAAS